MKKHILLTTTAMLLSAMALKANADSNSAKLTMSVDIRKPLNITEKQHLGFGTILANGTKSKVIVTPQGELGEGSNATMLSTGSFKNYFEGADGSILPIAGSFNEAIFNIDINHGGADSEALNAILSVSFADEAVTLMSDSLGDQECGTVTDLLPDFTPSQDGNIELHIGGTFTMNDELSTDIGHPCFGSTTLTIVFDDENYSKLMNSTYGNSQ